ncbi:MAG: transposase [Thermodesulfobacteriota bacterium]|nr:transposase [Thermodesulfobacteriota bacterium]
MFRVAISINRIKSIENGIIKFLCKDRQKKIWKTMTLDAMEFIRRFLQHILPKLFYEDNILGFLNCNSSVSIEKIRQLISFIHDVLRELLSKIPEYKKKGVNCTCCGKALSFIAFLKPPLR